MNGTQMSMQCTYVFCESLSHPEVPREHFQDSKLHCSQEHWQKNNAPRCLSRQQPCGTHGHPLQQHRQVTSSNFVVWMHSRFIKGAVSLTFLR